MSRKIRRASGPRRVRSRVKHPLQCLRPFDPAIPRSCDPGVVIGCFFLNKRAPPGGHLGSKRPCWSRVDCKPRSVIAKITRPNINQKIASIFDPKMHPKWLQNRPQNPSKNQKKINQFLHRVRLPFWMHFGIIFDPRDPWFLSSRPHEVQFSTCSRFRKNNKKY